MATFEKILEEELKDPRVKEGFEKLQPEREIMKAFIDLRSKLGITQKKLSVLTGIDQADISKLECGKRYLTIKQIVRIADALDVDLKIEIVPRKH